MINPPDSKQTKLVKEVADEYENLIAKLPSSQTVEDILKIIMKVKINRTKLDQFAIADEYLNRIKKFMDNDALNELSIPHILRAAQQEQNKIEKILEKKDSADLDSKKAFERLQLLHKTLQELKINDLSPSHEGRSKETASIFNKNIDLILRVAQHEQKRLEKMLEKKEFDLDDIEKIFEKIQLINKTLTALNISDKSPQFKQKGDVLREILNENNRLLDNVNGKFVKNEKNIVGNHDKILKFALSYGELLELQSVSVVFKGLINLKEFKFYADIPLESLDRLFKKNSIFYDVIKKVILKPDLQYINLFMNQLKSESQQNQFKSDEDIIKSESFKILYQICSESIKGTNENRNVALEQAVVQLIKTYNQQLLPFILLEYLENQKNIAQYGSQIKHMKGELENNQEYKNAKLQAAGLNDQSQLYEQSKQASEAAVAAYNAVDKDIYQRRGNFFNTFFSNEVVKVVILKSLMALDEEPDLNLLSEMIGPDDRPIITSAEHSRGLTPDQLLQLEQTNPALAASKRIEKPSTRFGLLRIISSEDQPETDGQTAKAVKQIKQRLRGVEDKDNINNELKEIGVSDIDGYTMYRAEQIALLRHLLDNPPAPKNLLNVDSNLTKHISDLEHLQEPKLGKTKSILAAMLYRRMSMTPDSWVKLLDEVKESRKDNFKEVHLDLVVDHIYEVEKLLLKHNELNNKMKEEKGKFQAVEKIAKSNEAAVSKFENPLTALENKKRNLELNNQKIIDYYPAIQNIVVNKSTPAPEVNQSIPGWEPRRNFDRRVGFKDVVTPAPISLPVNTAGTTGIHPNPLYQAPPSPHPTQSATTTPQVHSQTGSTIPTASNAPVIRAAISIGGVRRQPPPKEEPKVAQHVVSKQP